MRKPTEEERTQTTCNEQATARLIAAQETFERTGDSTTFAAAIAAAWDTHGYFVGDHYPINGEVWNSWKTRLYALRDAEEILRRRKAA